MTRAATTWARGHCGNRRNACLTLTWSGIITNLMKDQPPALPDPEAKRREDLYQEEMASMCTCLPPPAIDTPEVWALRDRNALAASELR